MNNSASLILERKQTNCPLTYIHTREDARVMNECRRALLQSRVCNTVYSWDSLGVLRDLRRTQKEGATTNQLGDLISLIEWFAQEYPGMSDSTHNANQSPDDYDIEQGPLAKSALFLFDVMGLFGEPKGGHSATSHMRLLKTVCPNLTKAFRSIFIVSHTPDISPELEGYCEYVRYQLPGKEWIKNIVSSSAKAKIYSPGRKQEIPPIELGSDELEAVSQELMGLTSMEIDEALATANRRNASAFSQNPTRRRKFDMSVIRDIKATVIQRSGTLSITTPPGGLELVGGMNNLKEELNSIKMDLLPESREDGIPSPKGFLMVGPGGTGKSLITKCIGSLLDMQVVLLDIGACKGAYVGQSEKSLRDALETINRISPCVLFVDEFEKMWAGSGGSGGGSQDGGTSSNMLQTWLRWMQDEKADGVIVIAACNEVRGLPGPVIRAGRFDDIIYVDLPGPLSRREIMEIHLSKRGWKPEEILTDKMWSQLKTMTRGFSGAEIERLVVKALRYKRGRVGYGRDKPPTMEDFKLSAKKVVPISRTHREELLSLREWVDKVAVVKASDEKLDFDLTKDIVAPQPAASVDLYNNSEQQREIDMGGDEY